LLAIVPIFAIWSGLGGKADASRSVRRSQVLPAFLIWFVVLALVRTTGDAAVVDEPLMAQVWTKVLGSALVISDLLVVCGMTAVGLNVSFRELRGTGTRAVPLALIVASSVALCSAGLIVSVQWFTSSN